jgi:hypothetical protein
MLKTKKINLNATPQSYSIKVRKDSAFFGSSLNFKLMEMAK